MPAGAEPLPTAASAIPGYSIERLIRSGGSAHVYAARQLSSGKRLALKVLHKAPTNRRFLDGLHREAAALARLRHSNIVLAQQFIETEEYACIAMQLASGGDLLDFINSRGPISESQLRRLLAQLLAGLAHAHKCGVAHLDLKPDNLLLDNERVLLADWGHAEIIDNSTYVPYIIRSAGTEVYKCPEMAMHLPYDPYKADAWSLGVTIFALASGRLPFSVRSPTLPDDIVRCRLEMPVYLSNNLKGLIRGLMCVDPAARLSVEEALHHDFLQERVPLCIAPFSPIAYRRATAQHTDEDYERCKLVAGA